MKTGYTLDHLLEDEKRRKVYAEKVKAADAELQKRMKSAPRLSDADRVKLEAMLQQIQGYNDYTFKYQKAREAIKAEFATKIKSMWDLDSYQGAGELGEYERANFRAMDLKRLIKSTLVKYTNFVHHHPDPDTLGHTTVWEEYAYTNIDPQVVKIQQTLQDLRNHGEEQMYQYKLRRGDPRNLIGNYTNEDMGVRHKK